MRKHKPSIIDRLNSKTVSELDGIAKRINFPLRKGEIRYQKLWL